MRLDSAKVNIAPPSREARWFRLVGVEIGNASELYPNGDEVQTVEPWTPPDLFEGLDVTTINNILNDIEAGLPDGNRYTDAGKATDRAASRMVAKHCPGKTDGLCRAIIKRWLEIELLIRRDYENPKTRKPVSGLWVNSNKRPT